MGSCAERTARTGRCAPQKNHTVKRDSRRSLLSVGPAEIYERWSDASMASLPELWLGQATTAHRQ
jgi:hypothetical protein